MRKKKTLISFCALLSAAVFATACGETAHSHTYSDAWSKNATDHWHAATCEHTDEISGKQPHLFEEGKCVVCGYPDPNYSDKDTPDTGDTDKDTPGTGDTDKDDPGTGDTDKDDPGTGDTDKDDPGTGDTDKDNPGTGDTEKDNPGTGDTDKDNPGTGDTDKDDPGEGEPDGNNLTDQIFEGDFTRVTSDEDIARLKAFSVKATRKIGAGYGYAEGDLLCNVSQGNISMLSYTLAGIEGGIESENLKFKQIVNDPTPGAVNFVRYAEGDTAYEEYSSDTFSYEVEDGCLILARNVVSNIWGTFAIAPSMFGQVNFEASYRTEGEYTVVKLLQTNVSQVQTQMGLGTLRQEITVEYVLLQDKIAGLLHHSLVELEDGTTPMPIDDTYVKVLIGNYPVEIPDASECTPGQGEPTWMIAENYPDMSVFGKNMSNLDYASQQLFFNILQITNSRLPGGVESVLSNCNYSLSVKEGDAETKSVYDIYNVDGLRIRRESAGEVVITDEEKSSVEKDGNKTEGASRTEELYGELEKEYEGIMELFTTFFYDYYGNTNYEVTFYSDEDFAVFKFTMKDGEGKVTHETTYVFSMFTNSLLGARDMRVKEDGTVRESTLLGGDYSVEKL